MNYFLYILECLRNIDPEVFDEKLYKTDEISTSETVFLNIY